MYLFRIIGSVFISLILVSSCWSSVDSPEQKAFRNAERSINRLYFDYVFAEENERLLRAIMVSVRRLYDRYELDQWLQGHSASGNQTEARQQLLTRLVQQATRHTVAKISGNEALDGSDRSMFHLLQALSNAESMQESLDVAHWFHTRPLMLQGVLAEDRMDSMESLIQEAVQNSFREFPSNQVSREQLARQLSFILLEMQERFLRGKALRSLSHKVDRQKQNPEIARDPAFAIYLSMMTKAFNNHPTLWHTDGKRRHYQEDLSALFMKAADREDYGNEWYQQIRRILDGEKPVPVTSTPPFQIPVTHHSPHESKEEGWFRFISYRAMLGMGASLVVMSTGVLCMMISLYETEPARQMRLQREKLQRKLGNTLNRPGRNDPKGRDWKPTKWDREQIKRATEGFDEKVIKNVLMQAGVLNPLTCNMDLADIYMQISLTELYSYLRQERYIWTAEDERRRRRQQEEEERYWAETETTHEQGAVGGGFGFSTYNFSSSDGGSGSTSFGTSTTEDVQNRSADWF